MQRASSRHRSTMSSRRVSPRPAHSGVSTSWRRELNSAELVDAHAEALGGESQGALPGGAGVAPIVVRLDARKRIYQVSLSNGAQNGRHRDVGHRELGASDPLAIFEAA